MMRRLAVLLVASQLAAAPLMAATVVPSAGRVSVNAGAGFRVVTGPVAVKPGDRVLVGPGGQASIQYGEGCSAPVIPGAAVAVAAGFPCTVGNVAPLEGPGGFSVLGPLLGGGALIGGIAAAAAFGSSGNNGPVVTPISP